MAGTYHGISNISSSPKQMEYPEIYQKYLTTVREPKIRKLKLSEINGA